MAGLDPAIQAATRDRAPRPEVAGGAGAWMAGSSPAMTRRGAAIGAVLQPERLAGRLASPRRIRPPTFKRSFPCLPSSGSPSRPSRYAVASRASTAPRAAGSWPASRVADESRPAGRFRQQRDLKSPRRARQTPDRMQV